MGMSAKRELPPKEKISQHWDKSLEYCWRCKNTSNRMERAHIVDRWVFGDDARMLDCVENLWMLCAPCHAGQPIFEVDEYNFGLAWMNLDAKGYIQTYLDNNDPRLSALKEESPEIYAQAAGWIATLLQSKWDMGNTNANLSNIF